MPYSFTQIEKDKSKTIWFVFFFLILFYFLTAFSIALVIKNYSLFEDRQYSTGHSFVFFDLFDIVIIFLSAICIALFHWVISIYDLINKILRLMKAESPALNDSYHQMFQNIVEEVSVATGGQKIEAVIVPSMAMNAFALSDFNGRSVIGITEGLLSRLTRAQIEAVVGHEAAHIVSGDCLATSVTSSLFQMYGSMLRGMNTMFDSSTRTSYRSRRDSGFGGVILIIYVVLVLTKFLSDLMNMFISRQREYRADAIAVRLTRDPLSLAGALYALGYRWRGQGLIMDELNAIFIVNPQLNALDDKESFFADLFSTHPPISKRLDVLLNLAHSNFNQLEQSMKSLDNKPRTIIPEAVVPETKWLIDHDGDWKGPFSLLEMVQLPFLTAESWVRKSGSNETLMAYQDHDIASLTIKKDADSTSDLCPKCKIPLQSVPYEGTQVQKCSFCKGVVVSANDVQKCIIRQEIGFPNEIIHIAEKIIEENNKLVGMGRPRMREESLYTCPICKDYERKMLRTFYTDAYRVEVDQCYNCKSMWFDYPEFEVLQYLIEKNTNHSV
jgi:heat shock protein HtpX